MRYETPLILAGLAVLAAILAANRDAAETYEAPEEEAFTPGLLESLFSRSEPEAVTGDALVQARRAAFLEMIKKAEGTANQSEPYAVLYGYVNFPGFNWSDHPGNLGWHGVQLSDSMCANAGFGPGCVSTAAGAYQIIKPTWNRLKKSVGLADFSPASQDRAALEIIRENHALQMIDDGQIEDAIYKVSNIWASLPGNTYAQGAKSIGRVLALYNDSFSLA